MNQKNIRQVVVTANVIEWYDFIVFAFLSPQIAVNFFPHSGSLSVLKALAVFAVSYIARPVGAIVLGWFSDRHGFVKSLRLSMFCVAIPCGLMTMIPTASSIGVMAPLFLILLRLIQSFGLGAEFPLSAQYAYSASQSNKKIFNSGLSAISAMGGMLMGSAVVALLNSVLSTSEMLSWGWRVAFLLSVPASIYIYRLRMIAIKNVALSHTTSQQATPQQAAIEDVSVSVGRVDTHFVLRLIFCVFVVGLAESIFYTVSVYMPEYLIQFKHVPISIAQDENTLTTLLSMLLIIPCCSLAQKKNVYGLFRAGSLFFIIAAIPLYSWINAENDAWMMLLPEALLVIGTLGFGVCNMPLLNKVFAGYDRSSFGICLAYTGGVAFLSAPSILLAAYMVKSTGAMLTPGVLVCIYAAALLILLSSFKRIFGKPLA